MNYLAKTTFIMNTVSEHIFQTSFDIHTVSGMGNGHSYVSAAKFVHMGQVWRGSVRRTNDHLDVSMLPVDLKIDMEVTYGVRAYRVRRSTAQHLGEIGQI